MQRGGFILDVQKFSPFTFMSGKRLRNSNIHAHTNHSFRYYKLIQTPEQ